MSAGLSQWVRPGVLPDPAWLSTILKPGPLASTLCFCAVAAMVVGAIGTIRTGRWWWRVVVLAGAAIWPLPDHPFQGPILVAMSYSHGIHLADLISLVGAIIAVLPWRRMAHDPDARMSGDHPASLSPHQ